jgi:hypothetical protein
MADKTGYFNVHKYQTTGKDSAAGKTAAGGSTSFVSPSDMMANLEQDTAMVVSFLHEPSGEDVYFKAFITTLNESYSSDWTEEQVFGRTDPIQLFKQTTRRISLGLKVPAETKGEAFDNLARIGKLTQFLYPSYSNIGQANTLSQGPVLRMKVMNLIRNIGSTTQDSAASDPDGTAAPSSALASYKSSPDSSKGLMGIITSLSINHNLENGDVGLLHHGANTILSTMIEINIDFTVIHERSLGWQDSGKGGFSSAGFPYGAMAMSDEDSAKIRKAQLAAEVKVDGKAAEPLNDQALLAAKKRYMSLGGKARMKKDLVWMNKMQDKMAAGGGSEALSAQELANFQYLGGALGAAGMTLGDTKLETKKEARQRAKELHDDFVD